MPVYASMTVRTRNRLIALSIIAAPFVFLACLLLFWDAEPLPPVPPLPNPNGYVDLVKAGETITGRRRTQPARWSAPTGGLQPLRCLAGTR